jgi:hypothetical protein
MQTIERLIDLIQGEMAGKRVLDTVAAVACYNRIVGSTDYAAAAYLLRDQLAVYGLDDVHIESFPIDGRQTYMGRVFAPAWEPHRARLVMLAPEYRVIADFAETPMCLPSGAPATASEGVVAEVIDVGVGDKVEHYAGLEVAGKAVLATGLTTDVYNLAVEQFGAACVMTTNMYDWSDLPGIRRSMVDLPDATHLARLYFDAEKPRASPLFSITHRQAERLRTLARRGPVRVQAWVEAESKPGELLEVVAAIQGADLADEEVWVLAHLCHPKPGACDNASGVALGVELFRTLATLIHSGMLARPRRTLRLLLLPEMSGTQAYMDRHQARMEKVVATINLDMVGAHHTTGAYCRLVQTPWSRPSFVNHLGAYVLERVSQGSHSHIRTAPVRDWLYALAPYDKGSDHDVTLNSIYAIPSLFFFYWPYRYYHTDLDTPDKLDPQEFERCGTVAATLALAAASMDAGLASDLLKWIRIQATCALTALGEGVNPPALETGSNHDALRCDRLWALGEREQGALGSVVNALPASEQPLIRSLATRLQGELGEILQKYGVEANNLARPNADWTPKRVEKWPLNPGKIEKVVVAGKPRWQALRDGVADFEDKAIEALNYVDGVRSVSQIARLVTGQLGLFPPASAIAYFSLLEEAGVVARA